MDTKRPARIWRTKVSVPVLLVALPLVILLPLIIFAVFIFDRFSESIRQLEHASIQARAISTSANIDREITGLINLGQALASSPSLSEGDYSGFHKEARQALRSATAVVILLAPSLQQLTNTRVPYGTALPKTGAPEVALKAMSSKKAAVSEIFFGRISQRLVFNVAVPVLVNGEVRYVLIVSEEPKLISSLLAQQMLPDGWNAAVRDGADKTFAANAPAVDPSSWVLPLPGKGGPAQDDGLMADQMVRGEPSILAYRRSALTGWTTVVWTPARVLEAPFDRMWRILYSAGLLALAVTVLVAYFFSLPFANLIRQTKATVAQVGIGKSVPEIRSVLSEGREIEASLQAADRQLKTIQRENRVAKALFDTLLANVPEGITVLSYPGFQVVAQSQKALEWMGWPAEEAAQQPGRQASLAGAFHADGSTPLTLEQSPAFRASTQNVAIDDEQYIIRLPDGSDIRVEVSVNPFHDERGNVIGTVSCWRDVTERLRTTQLLEANEVRLRLLLRELTHRAKNLLTIIMAIATQTARRNTSLEEFLQVFSRRIQGLGASHDLLVKSDWKGAPLADLVISQLSPFGGVDGRRISMAGPEVFLRPHALQALGLALHELATNATKYGALSTTKGTVQIVWDLNGKKGRERFRMTWSEQKGPQISKPQRKGFGHVIMVNSLAQTLDGAVDITFKRSGLSWTIDAKMESVCFGRPRAA